VSAVRVRAAEVFDLPAILEIERAAEAPHWAEQAYAAMVTGADAEAQLQRRLLVAEDAAGGVMGFTAGRLLRLEYESIAELESVVVRDSVRRQGVGRALCRALIDWCREQRARVVELEVRASNEAAQALYRGIGFTEIGQRAVYYQHPTEDAVLMSLRLE